MDKFFVFFTKGEKGLYFSNGRKMFFPDRDFKDAREGLAEVHINVGKDKGTYAFVSGKMIDNTPINMSELEAYCLDNNICDVHRLILLESEDTSDVLYACIRHGACDMTMLYQSEDGLKVCFELQQRGDTEKYLFKNVQRAVANWKSYSDESEFLKLLACRNAEEVTKDEVMELLVRINYVGFDNTTCVYDNKYIAIIGFGAYIKSKGKMVAMSSDIISKVKQTKSFMISAQEVKDFMYDHNISRYHGRNDIVVDLPVKAFDENFNVKVFNSSVFKMLYLNGVFNNMVLESAEEIKKARMHYGRHCTTQRQIDELRKLSPKNYL